MPFMFANASGIDQILQGATSSSASALSSYYKTTPDTVNQSSLDLPEGRVLFL